MTSDSKSRTSLKEASSNLSGRIEKKTTFLLETFWKNDKGFAWLLGITILFVFTTQFSFGIIWIERFLIRFSFFLFAIIAIASSVLSLTSKRIGYLIAVFILVYSVVLIFFPNKILIVAYSAIATFFLIFIWAIVIKQIFEGEKVTMLKIGGGVAAYILIGHIWTNLYLTAYLIQPELFIANGNPIPPYEAMQELSYFSFITLTTIGYGDIIAVGPFTRTMVIFEGLLGQLFPVVLIARLVSLHIEDSKK